MVRLSPAGYVLSDFAKYPLSCYRNMSPPGQLYADASLSTSYALAAVTIWLRDLSPVSLPSCRFQWRSLSSIAAVATRFHQLGFTCPIQATVLKYGFYSRPIACPLLAPKNYHRSCCFTLQRSSSKQASSWLHAYPLLEQAASQNAAINSRLQSSFISPWLPLGYYIAWLCSYCP